MSNQNLYTVYSASAGSGKTFTLVKEYLKILLQNSDVNHFRTVLAITFTNKAASEMKDRVLSNLQAFARGQTSEMLEVLKEETGLNTTSIQTKSEKIIEAILWDYSAFNITTIDSFTHRIIRTFAYDFGLSLNFDVEMDAKKLLQQAVDAVIAKIGIDKNLTEALITFSHQKSADDKTWDISKVLLQFASILLNETDAIELKSIAHKKFEDFVELQNQLQKKLVALQKKMREIGEEGMQLIARTDLQDNDFYRSMLPNHFNKLAESWETAKFFDQSKLRERIEENTLYSKSKPEDVKAKIEYILPQLLDLYLQSERLFGVISLSKLFSESLIPMAVLSYIHNAMEKLKEDNNVRLINEFNELIFKKIKDEPAPFIYERLGEKFQHFFIDEMQDTSVLQWKNLIKLIENSLHQEGGSLLLVGDAKQAIYRWRGGASEQFIELADINRKGPFYIDKHVAHLDTNYRSYTEVIHFNNSFFKHISKLMGSEMYAELYSKENDQKSTDKKGGFVQIELVDPKRDSDIDIAHFYPKKILDTINGLDESFEWKDVCILVRKHSQGVQIANYLNSHGIDIISSESLLLASDARVNFLINLLQIIQYADDETTRYKVLDFLYDFLSISIEKHQFFSERIKLDEDSFYESLKVYGVVFQPNIFHQKSLYDSLEYVLRSFNLAFESNAYLQFFLDEVLDFQTRYGSDLSGFLEHWEQKKEKLSISSPEGKNAIQIMTIHKAKGLQFPVVIFPYDLNIYQQINPNVWYPISETEKFEGFGKMLLPFRSTLQYTDEIGADLYLQRREMLELDNYNLLYVCLTRAEEQLYIITDNKLSKAQVANTNFYSGLFIHYLKGLGLWDKEQMLYDFGKKERITRERKKSDTIKPIESIETKSFISTDLTDHQVVLHSNSSLVWDTEQGKAIAYGNLIHEILAQILTVDDIDEVLQSFINQGVISENELKVVQKKIIAVVMHPELIDYFQQNLRIYNEREIVNKEGISVIPDRVVIVPNNKAVIIDYKTGSKDKSHQTQVEKYAFYLSEMGYEVIKKLLVYIDDTIAVLRV